MCKIVLDQPQGRKSRVFVIMQCADNSQFHRPSAPFGFLSGFKSRALIHHMTNSANQNSSCNYEADHMASIKIPTVILFCKHIALHIRTYIL